MSEKVPDRLAVAATGSPDRPAIVFLHGFLGRGRDWSAPITSLSSRFLCLAFDLPGHGESAACAHSLYSIPACAAAVIRELDRRKIERCSLCAYSMGGRLAYFLLTHYPDRIDRALIESSTPGIQSETDREARRTHDEMLAQRLERDGIGPFLVFWYRQPLFQSLANHPDRLETLVNDRLDNDVAALARSLRKMGTGRMPDLWPLIPQIRGRLCLVTGELDKKFGAIAESIVDLCPLAEHHILRGCGHAAHIEAPLPFEELAQQFFS